MIPALTFPNMTLPSTTDLEPDFFNMSGSLNLLDQSIDVPVFVVPSARPEINLPTSDYVDPNDIFAVPPGTSPPSIASPFTAVQTPFSTLNSTTNASTSPSESSQLQRNYDLLCLRNTRTVAENAELREVSRQSRAEIEEAEEMLQDVLGMVDIQGEAYTKLLDVTNMLLTAGGRLR